MSDGVWVEFADGPLHQQVRKVPVADEILMFTMAPNDDGRSEKVEYARGSRGLIGERYFWMWHRTEEWK